MTKKSSSLILFVSWVSLSLTLMTCDHDDPVPSVPTVPTTVTGSDDVSGTVTDPRTGLPRQGAEAIITVTPTGGGSYQDETTTDADGNYIFTDVPDGTGTVQVIYDGGITSQNIDTTATTETPDVDFAPPDATYAESRYIIVLSWNAEPRDLDSHLWVPAGPAAHVYFGYLGDSVGDLDVAPFAGLDHDDVNGYGPETVSIKINNGSAYYGGLYRYFVHKWAGTGNLTASEALVMVYRDGIHIKSYTVPTTGTTERYWHVFDLTGNTITDVNVLQMAAPGSS